LIQPTFVLDYPASLCPLTKRHRSDPRLAERFELYVHGMEFANAYTELTDPREQRRQFEVPAARRAADDKLAHLPDWSFVEALEYGITGGLGIGIDRVVMLLTGASHIQDVIPFPLHRVEPISPAVLTAVTEPQHDALQSNAESPRNPEKRATNAIAFAYEPY
jgi:lysyl-tRNA synthetase class 2